MGTVATAAQREVMLETHLNRTRTSTDERGYEPFVRVCSRLSASYFQDCEQLPIDLALPDGEVQIWRVALDLPPSSVEWLRQALVDDEIARAGRFRAPASRDRFIAAHGQLRRILGQYLNAEARQLQFCYGPYGKPFLAPAQNPSDIRFSLSHSHGLGLCAFARGRDVGVDIEYLDTRKSWGRIARYCLSASEQAALYALPTRARRAALFLCWTRKEAYLKATGHGLTQPLNQIEIGIRPGASAALGLPVADPLVASRWSLVDLAPGQGYGGALVVEGQDWRLVYRQWPEPTAQLPSHSG